MVLSNECITVYKKETRNKNRQNKKNEHLADAYEYARVKQKSISLPTTKTVVETQHIFQDIK